MLLLGAELAGDGLDQPVQAHGFPVLAGLDQ
jgi:hypothetical protein